MKNMKYLSLLAILGLLVGCTSDLTTEEVPQPPSVPEQKISHVVPVEQALEDLQGLLEAIDAPAEDGAVTRSGGIRRVKNVTTVSPEALSPGGTRSEATADVEDRQFRERGRLCHSGGRRPVGAGLCGRR